MFKNIIRATKNDIMSDQLLIHTKSQTIRANICNFCKMIPNFFNSNRPKSITALSADESDVLDNGSALRALSFDL